MEETKMPNKETMKLIADKVVDIDKDLKVIANLLPDGMQARGPKETTLGNLEMGLCIDSKYFQNVKEKNTAYLNLIKVAQSLKSYLDNKEKD